ncbi:MAG: acyl-CoA thioesterase [Ignavibacteriales bacterium]|nr:acyl-CoA thioesterase [Ignavibacteriales bacterium]
MVSIDTKIRVRYADTDQMKMVYHAKYLEYFEQGRSDLLREIGIPYPKIEGMGIYLPVIEAHARFLKAARYDDLLNVKTMLTEAPQARITIEYAILNADSNELLVAGYTKHGFINALTGKPTRAPKIFLDVVSKLFSDTLKNR